MICSSPIPAGIINIIRQLDSTGFLPDAALSGGQAQQQRCLDILRDLYGTIYATRRGWQLAYQPEWLQPQALPAGSILIDELATTQTRCRAEQVPCAVLTEHQTGGIGRQERRWFGLPADALALSLLLPVPANCVGLTVALGAMLASALSRPGKPLYFKWPNDIVNGQCEKIAGILTEQKDGWLIIGIGANWRLTPQFRRYLLQYGRAPAALAEESSIGSRQQCAGLIIETVRATVADYGGGFIPFRSLAEKTHIAAPGATIQIAEQQRVFTGFADDGALLTQGNDGYGRHIQGQVHYVACR